MLGEQIIRVGIHWVSKAVKDLIVLFACQTALGSKMHLIVAIYPLLVRDPNELINEASSPSFWTHRIDHPLESCSCK